MSKTVFILGAGASAHAGAPIMGNFIDKAEELKDTIRDKNIKKDFDVVFEKLNKLNASHTKANIGFRNNLEMAFAGCEMDFLLKPSSAQNGDAKSLSDAFKNLIVYVLEQSIQFRHSENHFQPSSEYNAFVQLIRAMGIETTSVLTFNYDLALDYAFHRHGIAFSYGLDDIGTYNYLKLHGSINWKQCSVCKKIFPMTMKEYLSKYILDNRTLKITMTDELQKRPHCDGDTETSATIVPPTWDKTRYHIAIGKVWEAAAKELSNAENIIICGYSFPPTDEFFKYLYALGSISNTRIKRFLVYNPDQKTEQRFKDLMGIETAAKFHFEQMSFDKALIDIRNKFNITSSRTGLEWI